MESAVLSAMSAVGPALFEMAWKSSVLVGVLLLAGRLTRRASAATRHIVWTGGIIALLGLPVLDAAVSWRVDVPGGAVMIAMPSPSPGTGSSIEARSTVEAGSIDRRIDPGPHDGARTGRGSLLLVLWLAGFSVVVLRLSTGWRAARAMVRRGEPVLGRGWHDELKEASSCLGMMRLPALLKSRDAALPFAVGLFQPAIVLPDACETWSSERRRAVLLHELAHVRRRDVAVHMLALLACAIHWYNPLVWLGARRLRAESERACDDLVLVSGVRASGYAADLLELVRAASGSSAPAVAVALAHSSEFEGRLVAMLRPAALRRAPSLPAAAAILIAVAAAAIPLAAIEPAAAPTRPSEPAARTQASADATTMAVLLRALADDVTTDVQVRPAAALGETGHTHPFDRESQQARTLTRVVSRETAHTLTRTVNEEVTRQQTDEATVVSVEQRVETATSHNPDSQPQGDGR